MPKMKGNIEWNWLLLGFVVPGGKSANLEVRPDNSWPDVVYYHSYTHEVSQGRELAVQIYLTENN